MVNRKALNSLYHRIGGDTKILSILRDFYRRMEKDTLVGFFFTEVDPDTIAEKQTQFLMKAMGATDTYEGKAPTLAHIELPPILAGHFDRRIVILEETLRDHEVGAEDIRTWIEFERSFRSVIQVKS